MKPAWRRLRLAGALEVMGIVCLRSLAKRVKKINYNLLDHAISAGSSSLSKRENSEAVALQGKIRDRRRGV
jgi:hypothetical protein